MTELVSSQWLFENLNVKDIIILDTSMTTTAGTDNTLLSSETIPGSRYFDLKGSFSDLNSPFPNTVPCEEQFENECQKLGVNQNSKIVVYDSRGIYSSPRVWWLFKIMGHENVCVLNGGLPEWVKNGHPTNPRTSISYEIGNFKASFQEKYVISYQSVLNNLKDEQFIIVDARSEGRFNGSDPEPRKHLKSGHILNSINIPFASVLDQGKYKSESELRYLFSQVCPIDKDLAFSCGSGLTACIVMLASEIAFKKGMYLYDGSWTEWAELQNLKQTL